MNKLVTLDLWQTIMGEIDLSSFSPSRRQIKCELVYDFLKKLTSKIELSEIEKSHDFVVAQIAQYSRFHSDKLFSDWLIIFLKHINKDIFQEISLEEINTIGEIIDKAFLDNPPRIFDGTLEFISFCKENNLKIGIISNTGFNSPAAYKQLLFTNKIYYDTISLSNELGLAKPDKNIFKFTLDKLNISPSNSIHIGDNPVADILGAINFGMDAILISQNNNVKPINNKVFSVIDNIKDAKKTLKTWI
ncbi:MAG: HAD-IA family hydrolase [Dehalococcoidales bacterium]|jgi:FMN phosphatase YigB (HAD superfamily)|nr:HAD-IA family hydrolase [Dehalococcoidales bacterium]